MFRPYFDVDHSFVVQKLFLILFPFGNKVPISIRFNDNL